MSRERKVTNEAAQQAAVLASKGLKLPEIAARLRTSKTTVSRLLKLAEEKTWLVKIPRCTLDPARVEQLLHLIYDGDLEESLQGLRGKRGGPLLEVQIVDSGEKTYAERLQTLAARAAPHIGEDLFPRMRKVGVTWGVTLRFLVDKLESIYKTPPREQDPIDFFPTCGDPPEVQVDALRSSSSIVTRLTRCFNGSYTSEHSFSGIGATIPAIFQRKEVETIRSYFRLNPRYHSVFGDGRTKGLIDECDTILTSVGSASGVGGPWLEAAAQAASIESDELKSLTLGNVAGLFLPRPGLRRDEARRLADVNERWTGIREEHLERCARAASESRVGVLMLAASKKTDIVLECLRRGLVNRLVIDQELAAGLARAIGKVA